MNVNRKEFIDALKRAMPGVESGNIILEGSDTFIFDDGFIHTYNDSISVSVPFPITNKEKENVSGAFKAKEFFDLINRYKDETLKLIPRSDVWILKSSNATAELTLLESSIIDKMKNIFPSKMKWASLPEKFIEGLSICKFSSNKSVLAGIFVQGNTLNSTDEIRINKYTLDSEISESFWITDSAATEITKLNNPKKYCISKSWGHFKTDSGDIFSCKRLAQANYPIDKINKLIDSHVKEKGDISNNLPHDLIDAVNRAAALSQNIESFNTVRLTFTTEGIEVFSQRPSGKYTENVLWDKPFKREIDPASIYVDYSMIENGIKYSKSFYLKKTQMKDKEVTRIIFVSDNGIQLISTFDGGQE